MFISGVHGQSVKALGSVLLPYAYYKDAMTHVEFQLLDSVKAVNFLGREDSIRFGLIA